jgi:hypothetical protein
MQRPIEHRHGPIVAILVSSVFFTLLHLTKDWALVGMVPVAFGAGVLLGTLASASGTLVFCMLGHWIMDIGLFAYWWTQIAGTFSQRPIFEVGVDLFFITECKNKESRWAAYLELDFPTRAFRLPTLVRPGGFAFSVQT